MLNLMLPRPAPNVKRQDLLKGKRSGCQPRGMFISVLRMDWRTGRTFIVFFHLELKENFDKNNKSASLFKAIHSLFVSTFSSAMLNVLFTVVCDVASANTDHTQTFQAMNNYKMLFPSASLFLNHTISYHIILAKAYHPCPS